MSLVVAVSVLVVFAWQTHLSFAQNETAAEQLADLTNRRGELQKDINELEEKIKEYQKELGAKRGEVFSLKNEIARINTQIKTLDLEIRKTENQIYITRLNIQETQDSIEKTTLSITEKRRALSELLRQIYKTKNEGLLERLLLYGDLSDILSQLQYLDNIQNKIRDVLQENEALKVSLEEQEINLKNNKADLEIKNAELEIKKLGQQTEKNRRDTVLQITKGEEVKYQQLLTQAEQEQATFLRELAKIEEQILVQKNFASYFEAGTIPKPGTKLFIWPEDNPRLTQGYGMTSFAKKGAYGGKGHNGIDIARGIGTPVKAAAGGTIIAKGEQSCRDYINPSCNGYWGNWVAIQHPGGLVTLYAHMTKPALLRAGEPVEAGEVIGYEGASGNITGPHLHFSVYTEFFTFRDPRTGELRISYNYNKTLNPLDYL